jgi:hypothetical protein
MDLQPVTISASTDALLILTQGDRSIVVHRLQVPFLLHQMNALLDQAPARSPVVDPAELDLCAPPKEPFHHRHAKPLLGILELRQIPHLQLRDRTDDPTWLNCLNRVGIKMLTEAAQQIAESGNTCWADRTTQLAFRLAREAEEQKSSSVQSAQALPDDLNDLPDGHPLKPRKGTGP